MNTSEIAKKTGYDVLNEILEKMKIRKGKKGKYQMEKLELKTNQSNPAYNLSLNAYAPRPPMWDCFWTKRDPVKPDEELEKEYADLVSWFAEKSYEIAASGKGKSMINNMLCDLRNEFYEKDAMLKLDYVSVASPDRKAAYAKADFKDANKVYGEVNALGTNELMAWSPSGWSTVPTNAENARLDKLGSIYREILTAYENERGQVPYTTIAKPVVPPRNYY